MKVLVINGSPKAKSDTMCLTNAFLKGLNIVLAYKGDWYHMMCIVDNTIYDKQEYDNIKDLKIIKVYKKI